MKALIIAATAAAAILSCTAPLQAATHRPALTLDQMLTGSIDRRGGGCDSARDRAQKPRCAKR